MGEAFGFLFGLEGRMRRSDWWLVRIVGLPVLVTLAVLLAWTGPAGEPVSGAALFLSAVAFGLAWWIDLATTVRRWHDRDQSGWMYFIRLIPIVGPIWTLVECGFIDGTPGPNQYGPSPKDLEETTTAPTAT